MTAHIIRIRGCNVTQTLQSFILFLVILYRKSHRQGREVDFFLIICYVRLGLVELQLVIFQTKILYIYHYISCKNIKFSAGMFSQVCCSVVFNHIAGRGDLSEIFLTKGPSPSDHHQKQMDLTGHGLDW